MKRQSKLTSHQSEQEQQLQEAQQQSVHEFATVEEMLRHDALHTPVPPSIEHCLQESIGPEPARQSWWQRWFGS
jgi:hypothetical protein